MADFIPLKATMSFRLNGGTSPTGNMIVRTVTIPGIASNLTANPLGDVADLCEPLFEFPVIEVSRAATDQIDY